MKNNFWLKVKLKFKLEQSQPATFFFFILNIQVPFNVHICVCTCMCTGMFRANNLSVERLVIKKQEKKVTFETNFKSRHMQVL